MNSLLHQRSVCAFCLSLLLQYKVKKGKMLKTLATTSSYYVNAFHPSSHPVRPIIIIWSASTSNRSVSLISFYEHTHIDVKEEKTVSKVKNSGRIKDE